MHVLNAVLLALAFALVSPVQAQEAIDIDAVQALADAGETQDALAKLDEFLADDPDNLEALFLKGLLQLEGNDASGARQTFTDIARRYPRLPEAFNNLAAIYAGEGEYEKARNALLSAIANAPDYPAVRSNLGDLYVEMAADAYEKSLELDQGDPATAAKLKHLQEMLGSD